VKRRTLMQPFGSEHGKLAPVDKTVRQMNIDHYRYLLETETDQARKKVILELLAEEVEALRAAELERAWKAKVS
jgi:hypothetical protein